MLCPGVLVPRGFLAVAVVVVVRVDAVVVVVVVRADVAVLLAAAVPFLVAAPPDAV